MTDEGSAGAPKGLQFLPNSCPKQMRFLVGFKRVHPAVRREAQAGAGERVPGNEFHAQAAWILLLTLLKPRFWSTFVRNSQTVQRISSFPMLMRIAAQAAAIRAALLQIHNQSNDFSHFLIPETLLAPSKCPCHSRCTLRRDSVPTALIYSPCEMITLRFKHGYRCRYKYRYRYRYRY